MVIKSSLRGFKYLQLRRIPIFMLVLTLSSMLSSITAFSLLSFYRGLSMHVGGGENVVVIYDERSRTPFTGLVPAFLADEIAVMDGVLACSPEVIAPCIIKGESAFLRGVLLNEFLKISGITMVEGEMFGFKDLNSAIVGKRIAGKVGLKVGDSILVTGVLSAACLELRIKGIFRSGDMLEDEIIAPLHVGQWLRGAGYNHVTIIRVKVGGNAKNTILNIINDVIAGAGLKLEQPTSGQSSADGGGLSGQSITGWAATRLKVGDVDVEWAEKFMEDYMGRYGVSREAILIASVTTLLFCGASILLATGALISQHGGEIEALRFMGASRRLLRRDLTFKLVPASMLASVLGVVAAAVFLSVMCGKGLLQVLFHTIQLQIDPFAIILIVAGILVMVVISVWKSIG